jgi:hypothetical protein
MQDWSWEVADATRLDEFLAVYQTASLTDDERFTLMEVLLQSFEDRAQSHGFDSRNDHGQAPSYSGYGRKECDVGPPEQLRSHFDSCGLRRSAAAY